MKTQLISAGIRLISLILMIVTLQSCKQSQEPLISPSTTKVLPEKVINEWRVDQNVSLRHYHNWIDSTITAINQEVDQILDEYILVHANSWILDSLQATDYYHLKDRQIEVQDLQSLTILRKGQKLIIPSEIKADSIRSSLASITLDLNIPEFRLRILQEGTVKYELPVRVGKNDVKYLAMSGREEDLRTKSGKGIIWRVNKEPVFINPKDNKRYDVTRRDDNRITTLPNIPWLEPELDGKKHGQLIHPTTNLKTIGKASSNGCIGLRESDAWIVYYHAPVGTKVEFRYDLIVKNAANQRTTLPNIYSR